MSIDNDTITPAQVADVFAAKPEWAAPPPPAALSPELRRILDSYGPVERYGPVGGGPALYRVPCPRHPARHHLITAHRHLIPARGQHRPKEQQWLTTRRCYGEGDGGYCSDEDIEKVHRWHSNQPLRDALGDCEQGDDGAWRATCPGCGSGGKTLELGYPWGGYTCRVCVPEGLSKKQRGRADKTLFEAVYAAEKRYWQQREGQPEARTATAEPQDRLIDQQSVAAVVRAAAAHARAGVTVSPDTETDGDAAAAQPETAPDSTPTESAPAASSPIPGLTPAHYHELRVGSGIPDDFIRERGYRSIGTGEADRQFMREQGFTPAQYAGKTGYILPSLNVVGRPAPPQFKPDHPRVNDGKPVKYESPAGQPNHLDVHPRNLAHVKNAAVMLVITEGRKKTDAATAAGLCVVGLTGVNNFVTTGANGSKGVMLPDFAEIPLERQNPEKGGKPIPRDVVIGYDDDVMTKPAVHKAAADLAARLALRGAKVRFLYLPPLPDGAKCGLDDFFVAGNTVSDFKARIEPELRPLPGSATDLTDGITGSALLTKTFAKPVFAIDGMVVAGLNMLVGKPKIGKSWWMLQAAVATAAGGTAFGKYAVDQGDVLYLALEEPEWATQERLRKIMDGLGLTGDEQRAAMGRITFFHDWPRLGDGGAEKLRLWLTAHPEARLINIDTLVKLRPRKERGGGKTLYEDDYDHIKPLKDLAQEFRVPFLCCHHQNKMKLGRDSEDILDSVSGSTGLTGAADALLILTRSRLAPVGRLIVTGRTVREQEFPEFYFDAETNLWSDGEDDRAPQLDGPRRALLDALGSDALKPKELAGRMGQKDSYVRTLLSRMVAGGQVQRLSDGEYCAIPRPRRAQPQGAEAP